MLRACTPAMLLLIDHTPTYPCRLPATPAAEWRASIEDSHPPSPARDAALATHDKEVDTITRALGK